MGLELGLLRVELFFFFFFPLGLLGCGSVMVDK